LGKHDAVARAVAAGQVPAGALSESIYRVLVKDGKIDPAKLTELALSDPIPNYPMTMQGYLAPELKEQIRKAFLELNDPEILKLFRVQKLAPATDKDYDVLRDMATTLKLDIAKL
ncbi:MAG: putative phosphite transport system-binding protein PtxB, partial [Pseudomonadota bacterium]